MPIREETAQAEMEILGTAPATPEEKRALRKEVIRLAWPAAIQNLLQTLIFVVDTKMIGELGDLLRDPTPLAALQLVNPIAWSTMVIFTALSIGTQAVVAREIGKRRRLAAREASANAMGMILLVGGVVSLAMFLGAGTIVRLFAQGETSPLLLDRSRLYLQAIMAGFVFKALVQIQGASLRGAGDTMSPMIATAISNTLNIVGNYVLIFGNWGFPRLEVWGAGISTAIAMGVEAVLLHTVLFSRPRFLPARLLRGFQFPRIRVRWSDFTRLQKTTSKVLTRISIPATLEAMAFHSAFLIYQLVIIRLGEIPMAANRVAITLESAAFMPAYGIYMAAATICGQKLGEKRPDLAERGVYEAARIGLGMLFFVSFAFALFPERLASLFTTQNDIVYHAAICLAFGAMEIPFLALSMIFSGGLRGAGETKTPMLATLATAWMIRVPLAWILGIGLGWGLAGVWLAALLDWVVRSVILIVRFRKGKWKTIQI